MSDTAMSTDDCVTLGITGFAPGETPCLRICVPVNDRGRTATRIIEALFGSEVGLDAAVARFKGYAEAITGDKEPA